MDTSLLPILLGLATTLPLVSFFVILSAARWLPPKVGGYIATSAIVAAGVLSLWCLIIWLAHYAPQAVGHHPVEHARADNLHVTPVALTPADDSMSVKRGSTRGFRRCGRTSLHRRLLPVGTVRKAAIDDQLLHRLVDHRHVLHGFLDCLVHSLLRHGLHARRRAHGDRPRGDATGRFAPEASRPICASSSTCPCSRSACSAWYCRAMWRWFSSSGSWLVSARTS